MRLAWRLVGQLVLLGLFLISSLILLISAGWLPLSSSGSITRGNFADPSTAEGQLILVASAISVAASVWAGCLILDRRPVRQLGFSLNSHWILNFLFGFGLGAILMTAVFLLELGAGWVEVESLLSQSGELSSTLISLAGSLGLYTIIGFYEELYNRGYLIKNISEGLCSTGIPPIWSIASASLISALIFGILHSGNPHSSLWSILNITLAGLFLGSGYLLTGQLALPIGLHISWNFFQGSFFGFPVSGIRFSSTSVLTLQQLGPASWTGGEFGPEAGLLGTAAMLWGTAAILLWAKYQQGSIQLQQDLGLYQPLKSGPNQPAGLIQAGNNFRKTVPLSSKPAYLIWDWNGTLLDDLDLCLKIINQMLKDRRLPAVSQQRYLDIFGFPIKDYYQRLGFDFTQEPFENISTEFITAYEYERSNCQLMPGTRQALSAAADLSFSQSILSASKKSYLLRAVNEYKIAAYFDAVLGLDNHHAAGKKQLAINYLSGSTISPDKYIMIGDTVHDAKIARALHIQCLLIPQGHHSRQRLEKTGSQIVENITQIPEILSGLKREI